MLFADVVKEIKQENKIIFGLTVRKLVCILIAIISSIFIALFLPKSISLYVSLFIGFLCFAFGWAKKDGMTIEKYIFKFLKTSFYGNEKRKYKTKNKYILLMNKEYKRHKAIDMNNKQIKKIYKKENKKNRKTYKKSKMKEIL